MTDDLVTRGRKLGAAAMDPLKVADPMEQYAIQAADRIEQDAVTIARLTGEVASWRMASTEAEKEVAAVRAQRVSAEAQVAALVEALQKIAEWPDYRLPKPCDIARAAIAAAKGE